MRNSVGRTRIRPRNGLTLFEAVLAILLCVGLLGALHVFGYVAVMTAIYAALVILGGTVLWGLAYIRAPDLTRNASVLVLIGMVAFAWLPNRTLHTREAARRQQTRNSLRQIGQVLHALHDTASPGSMQDRFGEHRHLEAAEDGQD